MDFEQAGLLDGLEGDDRDARQRLLEQLAGDGVGLEELTAAVAENRLALLPVERVLGGRYTARRASRSGPACRPTLVLRFRRLLGLPARRARRPRLRRRGRRGRRVDCSCSSTPALARTRSPRSRACSARAMSRLAATTTGGVRRHVPASPATASRTWRCGSRPSPSSSTPALAPVLVGAFSAHLREACGAGSSAAPSSRPARSPARRRWPCASPTWSASRGWGARSRRTSSAASPVELGELAANVASRRCGWSRRSATRRCSSAPSPARWSTSRCRSLESAEQAEDFPRCAPASPSGPALPGPATSTGTPSTLPAASPGAARPGSVLCTKEVRDATPNDFHWSPAGRHQLKGLSSAVPLYRARRPDGQDDSDATNRRAGRRRKRASS